MKLIPVVLGFVILLIAAFPAGAQQATPADELAIRQVTADFAGALNRRDVKSLGKFLLDDAEFVVVSGKYLRGREEIQTHYIRIWARDTRSRDSSLSWTPMNLWLLRHDVAVTHAIVVERIHNDSGERRRKMVVTVVLAKLDTKWFIALLQETETNIR